MRAPTHLHFDCYSGISGDMTLGALVDLGVSPAELETGLRGLAIGPFTLRAERVKRQGIMGTKLHVEVEEDHGPHGHPHGPHDHGSHAHRHLADVLEVLERAALPPRAARRAARAYRKLAEAEALVHGSTPEAIHFHEVGAKDAILDVAGAMLGIEFLGVESFSTSTVNVGFGTVQCHHGLMPVPAPATAELLKGLPQAPGPIQAEMVTPTGAAILGTLLEENAAPAGAERVVERVGYGAGDRIHEGFANFLRLALCRAAVATPLPGLPEHAIAILETEIDDMSPEVAGYLMERLLADGAYDVQFSPVQMKKNRPALRLRVLCEPGAQGRLAELVFRETSTFGIRHQLASRWCLERRIETVQTALGPVEVKLGLWDGRVLKASPEYESCRKLALERGVALSEVYAQACEAARKIADCGSRIAE